MNVSSFCRTLYLNTASLEGGGSPIRDLAYLGCLSAPVSQNGLPFEGKPSAATGPFRAPHRPSQRVS